jgi:hypothetical protein
VLTWLGVAGVAIVGVLTVAFFGRRRRLGEPGRP